MEGLAAEDYDQPARDAFVSVTADALSAYGVDSKDIVITNIVNYAPPTRRRSLREVISSSLFSLSTANAEITFDTSVVLEDTSYTDVSSLMSEITSDLTTTYSDPTTANTFVTRAVQGGSTTITVDTVVVFESPAVGEPQTEVVKTGAPTITPTMDDDVQSRGGGGSDSNDQEDVVAYVLSFCLLFVVIGAVVWYFIFGPGAQKSASLIAKTVEDMGSTVGGAAGSATITKQTKIDMSSPAVVISPFQSKAHDAAVGSDQL
jgi:hypothetical protein